MANYPIPVFHFSVSLGGGAPIGFSEVSGLTQEVQAIDYRDGLMSYTTLPLKRPGLKKASNITLKKGYIEKDNNFYNWLNNSGNPGVDRRDLTITLLNDENNPVFVWSVTQAWPVKIEGPGLKATGNEIAIESIELVHEGIVVTAA
ncbi:phage tail protein [Mucilaginibacter ginsenosidivorax]|uniref:Phage tail protein n=1 Tax=Mucilaginibacter ginsenosidivorax TaxID=862126 RepID=A0A5B8W4Y3_9SPHI|nr:phage tail protein [Mucilaginibacter ginsenosidivorax]QEC77992.1 phage tail protein [Mucilaginibacter ginsenosidivorax]